MILPSVEPIVESTTNMEVYMFLRSEADKEEYNRTKLYDD